MDQRCNSDFAHSDAAAVVYTGRAWISGCSAAGPTHLHVKTPNTFRCHFSLDDKSGDVPSIPSSNHPGGINLLLADGHVTFIEYDIDDFVRILNNPAVSDTRRVPEPGMASWFLGIISVVVWTGQRRWRQTRRNRR